MYDPRQNPSEVSGRAAVPQIPAGEGGCSLARLPRPLTRIRYLQCRRSGDSTARGGGGGVTLPSAGVPLPIREHPKSVLKAGVTFGGGACEDFWGVG